MASQEDVNQYMLGWQAGAVGKKIKRKCKTCNPAYMKGHGDGCLAWEAAIAAVRIRLGVPSTSCV